MNFLQNAITHWKTSVAGVAGGLAIVATSYHAGMTWKQWVVAAAVALLGLTASDAQPESQGIGGMK